MNGCTLSHMDQLTLPSVKIVAEEGELSIRHTKTGMVARVSPNSLDRWALRMLRDELSIAPSKSEDHQNQDKP